MSFSPFNFGTQVYTNQGVSGVVRVASAAYRNSGILDAGLFVAGAASPIALPVLGVASTLFAAKTIYDGLTKD